MNELEQLSYAELKAWSNDRLRHHQNHPGQTMNGNRTSHDRRKVLDDDSKSSPGDWLAWSLQLLIGFLAGCGVGYRSAQLLYHVTLNELLFLAVGGGLICGAFTSYYGNRVWMAASFFSPPEPTPPRKARAFSLLIGGIGAVVVIPTVIHHLIAVEKRDHYSSASGFSAFLFLAAAFPGFLLIHALRTGSGFWRFGIIEREETPLIFWIYVVLNAVATLSILSIAL